MAYVVLEKQRASGGDRLFTIEAEQPDMLTGLGNSEREIAVHGGHMINLYAESRQAGVKLDIMLRIICRIAMLGASNCIQPFGCTI